MLNFTDIKLNKIIVHHIGSKSRNEGIKFSKHLLNLKEDIIQTMLLQYFLNPFKTEALYHFTDNDNIENNNIYRFASEVFNDPNCFNKESQNIAKHLYSKSEHPKINGGEFYIVYFKDIVVEDEITDAIGLFKSENKDTYLKVYQKNEDFEIGSDEGININKLDKGCLIFNTDKENGYLVAMVDNLNKTNEAQYWKDDFLRLKPREDNFFHTQSMLNVCKDFCDQVLIDDEELSKQSQILIKDRSLKYFGARENFNEKEFEAEVMQEPEIIEAFQNYKQKYFDDNNTEQSDEFEISANALKFGKKNFKSVLKLDKNFHVYIHGNPELAQKGFDDDKKMNYYKLFFNEEG
jgi:hypothetical protein